MDVEILKGFGSFLNAPAFSGFEAPGRIGMGVIGSEKKGKWVKELLDIYKDRHFIVNGRHDKTPMPDKITQVMIEKGLKQENSIQIFDGFVHLYPTEYFYPKNFITKELKLTENTYCIHYFARSWWTKTDELDRRLFIIRKQLRLL